MVGVGVDVVEIGEFEHIPFESNRRFYERCFSATEIAYCRSRPSPAQHFAARFAAKEAAVKAASSVARLLPWQVAIESEESGMPCLHFWDETGGWQPRLSGHRAFVSLSHSRDLATAVVVLCSETD
jgi:holo-[acyl-carrier protein] synthase